MIQRQPRNDKIVRVRHVEPRVIIPLARPISNEDQLTKQTLIPIRRSSNMNATRFGIVLFAALSIGSCSRGATPSTMTDAISVGGTIISLPAPDGFSRYDGKSTKVDSFEQQFVPATNRLLAIFGSKEALGDVVKDQIPKRGRYFAAESKRSLETRDITASLFGQLKPPLRRMVSSPLAEKYLSVIKEMESNASSHYASLRSRRLRSSRSRRATFQY